MKPKKIPLENYDSLLKEVKSHVLKTGASIERIVVRKKVELAWSIGKSISQHIQQNPELQKSSYGKHLFLQLESDVGIALSTLYKMLTFYKTYPTLPRDNEKLNWSHYQLLSGIKKKDERRYLEDLIIEKNLNVAELREEIKKPKSKTASTLAKLTPRRGELSCYRLIKPDGYDRDYIDCGFKIYREIPQKLPKEVKLINSAKSLKLYTYKASLKRVVDGDTLRVILDLGFGTMHEEILRLRGINAIEAEEKGGKKATAGLIKILKDYPSFIVKTSSTDTYNRYLADIFLGEEGVSNEGIYLNQLLLDKKLAVLF